MTCRLTDPLPCSPVCGVSAEERTSGWALKRTVSGDQLRPPDGRLAEGRVGDPAVLAVLLLVALLALRALFVTGSYKKWSTPGAFLAHHKVFPFAKKHGGSGRPPPLPGADHSAIMFQELAQLK